MSELPQPNSPALASMLLMHSFWNEVSLMFNRVNGFAGDAYPTVGQVVDGRQVLGNGQTGIERGDDDGCSPHGDRLLG